MPSRARSSRPRSASPSVRASGAAPADWGAGASGSRNGGDPLPRLPPGAGPALFSLPATPAPLVTRLAFLLLARVVLERSAQASGLSLLPRHRGRFLLAPRGVVQGYVGARPCEPPLGADPVQGSNLVGLELEVVDAEILSHVRRRGRPRERTHAYLKGKAEYHLRHRPAGPRRDLVHSTIAQ